MKDWERMEAPHDPKEGSGIPLWRQRIPKEGWLVVSGTGSIAFIPDTGRQAFDRSSWQPKTINNDTANP